jgi:hypothetical protein
MNPSAEFVGELFAGNLYINVHSTEFPGGAIRGQLTADPFDLQHLLYFPQFGNGGGLASDIVLQNLSDTDVVHGQIRFFDPEGGPFEVGIEGDSIRSEVDFSIAPLDAITVSTDGSGGEALAGSAVALSDGLLGGVVRFEIAGVGIAGVGAASSETRVMMPVRKEGMGINTGVAARNTSAKTITIQAVLLRGGEEVEQANLDLPVDGRVSQFIDDIFPDSVGLDYSGTLVLSCADGSFASIALELDVGAKLFTTLPVSPLP